MDGLRAAVEALTIHGAGAEEQHWRRLEEALDLLYQELWEASLEQLLSDNADLPGILGNIGHFFTRNWWCTTRKFVPFDSADDFQLSILCSYLRLLKLFYTRAPNNRLETTSNNWVTKILQRLSEEASSSEKFEDTLVLAMVKNGFAPEEWLETVAAVEFDKAVGRMQSMELDVLLLPAVDMRKLLVWSCCAARVQRCRETLKKLLQSLQPAANVLSVDCFNLYAHLKELMNEQYKS